MTTLLSALQERIASRVLAEEGAKRQHLVVALSGAHAYGFPSPDSDLDLKGIHIAPTAQLLGLRAGRPTYDRLEFIEGVEIDYTSNELQMALAGILAGNGNYLERVLGPHPLVGSPLLEELRPLVRRSLSKRLHRHYRGFATSQRLEAERASAPSAKQVLYVLRTALTGTHALLTGEIVTDLSQLCERYGVPEAHGLITAKRAGERTVLDKAEREFWLGRVGEVFTTLDEAHQRSVLPEEPDQTEALEAWLVEVRRRQL